AVFKGKAVNSASGRRSASALHRPSPHSLPPDPLSSAPVSPRDLPRAKARSQQTQGHRRLCASAVAVLRSCPPPPGEMAKAFYAVGFWIRETGQALDRLGCRLQGNYFFHEQISRHRTLMNIFDKAPHVHKEAFVAPSASLIGDVEVGQGSSIWYGCVLRGDANNVQVGSGTNIQDNSVVHVAKSNLSGKVFPTIIGDNVTVGHSAVLQGCTVEDEAFVGMGATLLDGVVVEKHGMVAAGALVRQNTRIPCGEVV
uniref:Uncharacterized protein n=1 Tax=Aegilops tauschii subsp. strangulata TaxID=200361 RepID=A0A453ESM2_AEGTS